MAEVKATIKAVGDAFVITAGFKFKTLKDLIKYGKSAALTLTDKETKEPYFKVNVGKVAEATKYGIVFTGANKAGYAECTGTFPQVGMTEEKKTEYLKDNFALVLANVNTVQTQVTAAEKELNAVMEVVDASITVE